MNDPRLPLVFLQLAFAAMLFLCTRVLLRKMRVAETLAKRLREINAGPPLSARDRTSALADVVTVAVALGAILMRKQWVPRKTLHEAELLLAGANLRGETVVAGFIGGKVLLLAGLPPLAWTVARLAAFSDGTVMGAAVAGAAVALILPDFLLGRRRRRRLAAIGVGLPDALDLLVICVDAGLAFEAALERVTREIAPVHPQVAEEFSITVNALRISSDRRAVLKDMGTRLDVDFLRQLAATLAQALQLGAPLSRPLRLLAQELRREQITRIEARAARLPVLLTIPMVMFIMPTVLLVVGGPAAIQVLKTF